MDEKNETTDLETLALITRGCDSAADPTTQSVTEPKSPPLVIRRTTRAYTDGPEHFASIARELADWLARGAGQIDIAENGAFVTRLERVAKSGAYNGFPTPPLEIRNQDGGAVLRCRFKSDRFDHPLHGNASEADWDQVRIDAAYVLRECADDAESRSAKTPTLGRKVEAVAIPHGQSADDNEGEALKRMLAFMDSGQARAIAIVDDPKLNTDEKLRIIARIDERFFWKKSPELGKILRVTPQMIRDTMWWKVDRKAFLKEDEQELRE